MKFKKFLSLLLTLSIFMSLGISVFAEELVPTTEFSGYEIRNASINRAVRASGESKSELVQTIENDVAIMNDCSIPMSDSLDVRYSNGKLEYLFEYPQLDYNCSVSLRENNRGDITFTIKDSDDCCDTIEQKADGTIVVNGSTITFGSTAVEDNYAQVGTYSARARYDQYSATNFCPGATYVSTGNKINRTITSEEEVLRKLAKFTIATLIATAIGNIPGAVVSELFMTIAGDFKTTAEVYAPTSKVGSFSLTEYAKSPQDVVLSLYYKYSGSYYVRMSDGTNKYAGFSTYYRYNYYA